MRFLLMTQPYEKTIASGTYSYQFLNEPTGWIEHWRLSDALEGYRFFRIDEDAREADGNSTLFIAVINPDGQFESIKFRYWGQGTAADEKRVEGQLLFEPDHLLLIRNVAGERFEEEIENDYPFVFQGASGLNFLLNWQVFAASEKVFTFGNEFELETQPLEIQESDEDKQTLIQLGDSDIVVTRKENRLAQIIDWTEGDLLAEGKRLMLKK